MSVIFHPTSIAVRKKLHWPQNVVLQQNVVLLCFVLFDITCAGRGGFFFLPVHYSSELTTKPTISFGFEISNATTFSKQYLPE